jgi:hypothetical protein
MPRKKGVEKVLADLGGEPVPFQKLPQRAIGSPQSFLENLLRGAPRQLCPQLQHLELVAKAGQGVEQGRKDTGQIPQGISQQPAATGLGQHGSRTVGAGIELAQIQMPPHLGIGRKQHLKAAIQTKVFHRVGAHPPAGAVAFL